MAHNCHGKTKNLTAKTKTSRENQNPHGKTKYFTAKTKYLTAEANNHSKTKAILFLLWSIWFCREAFGFAVRYFVFASEVFGFAVMYFVLAVMFLFFAVRFLVLPWQLWATILKRVCCHSLWIGSKLQSSCQEPITTCTLEVTNLLSTVFVDFVKSYSWKFDCDLLKQWDWSLSPCFKSTYS